MAPRIYQLVLRFGSTLGLIPAPWTANAHTRTGLVQDLCGPYLFGRWPSLADIRSFLLGDELSTFRESAVDTELFAVLRALDSEKSQRSPVTPKERAALERKRVTTSSNDSHRPSQKAIHRNIVSKRLWLCEPV